ncbi:MAG: TonB family protein [Brevinematia bacterium]
MRKPIYFYMYLSLVIHLYVVLIYTGIQNSSLFERLIKSRTKKTIRVENIFVETFTYSKELPKKAILSDKQNINSSPKKGENIYNYVDFNQFQNENTTKKNSIEEEEKEGNILENREKNKEKDEFKIKSEKLPTLFDPEKPGTIEMDTEGNVSLGTVEYEFASYFLEMQKKISANWRTFFPVFQYYQGIIKTGEVIIRYQIDEDGNVKKPTVLKSYGYSILDQSCLNSIVYSRNFGPLPEKLKKQAPITINFKFIYIAR